MQLLRKLLLLAVCAAWLISAALGEEAAPIFNQDGGDYQLTVQGVTQNDRGDTVLTIHCENHTDHLLTFGWSQVSVMGCMIDPLWAATAEAHSAVDSEVCFEHDMLQAMGIDAADEITFTLTVLDPFSWSSGKLLEETYTLYPNGQAPAQPDRLHTDSEIVLADDDSLLLVVLDAELNIFSGYVMDICLENRTDRHVLARLSGMEMNGLPLEPMWSSEVLAGKRLYTQIAVPQYLLSSAGIASVEQLTMTMQLCDLSDWSLPVVCEYPVTVLAAQ